MIRSRNISPGYILLMSILAQLYYDSSSSTVELTEEQAVAVLSVSVALSLILIVSMWRLFRKAGQPGWHAIVPILNTYTLIKVAGRPGWWLFLYLVPCVNYVVAFIVFYDLAKAFGRSSAFGVGTALFSPIFIPVLAFGSSEHYSAGARERALERSHRPPPPSWNAVPGGFTVPGGIAAPTATPWPVPGAQGTAPLGPTASPPALPGLMAMPPIAPAPAIEPAPPIESAPEIEPTPEMEPTPVPPIEPTPVATIEPTPVAAIEPTSAPEPAAGPIAGWYEDPADSGRLRYWDGAAWTDHLQ